MVRGVSKSRSPASADAVSSGTNPDATIDPPAGDEPEIPTDGRAARAVRTRTAIVDALLALLQEGDLQPPANRIAERAGISLRLIYHHFGDLESLFRAAANRWAERIAAISEPIDVDLPLAERIDRIVNHRAKVLEMVTPVRRAAILQEPFSEELRNARNIFTTFAEHVVGVLFEKELAALSSDERAATTAALSNTMAWGFWNDLRVSGRTVDEARAAMLTVVRALLKS